MTLNVIGQFSHTKNKGRQPVGCGPILGPGGVFGGPSSLKESPKIVGPRAISSIEGQCKRDGTVCKSRSHLLSNTA